MKTFVGSILTQNGKNLLTAANAGGLGGPDSGAGVVAVHTDATTAGVWETFKLILQPGSPPIGPGMQFALRTASGTNYLTAVNGGGIGGPNDSTCPVHTDATFAGPWEIFTLLVDDTVNPPTVKLSIGGHYVTAVNGGGVGGPNTQPVHTDATSIGPSEQFSLSSSTAPVSTATSIPLFTNTNISGPANGNIAGSVSLTLNSDGSYSFSGHMNNSNWFPYNMAVAVVVATSKGTGLSFGVSGTIDAALPWDNNNWSWGPITGNSAALKSAWGDLPAQPAWWVYVSASLDLPDCVTAAISALKAIGAIVQVVETIVAAAS